MSLENLKSIFSPLGDTESKNTQSDLSTFDSEFKPPPGVVTSNLNNFYRKTFSTAGLDESSFSPLSSLGINLYNGEENNSNPQVNMSWQSLYLTQQKNKNNPGWSALSPISYNENVNRDKLNKRN